MLALIVRPATTARMVAKATALMKAKKTSPPSACASSGALMFSTADIRRREDRRRAEAEEGRHDVEEADDDHRPDDGDARRLRIGHGVEADEDVRQSGGAEDEREAERDEIDRAPALARRAEDAGRAGESLSSRSTPSAPVTGDVADGVEELRRS